MLGSSKPVWGRALKRLSSKGSPLLSSHKGAGGIFRHYNSTPVVCGNRPIAYMLLLYGGRQEKWAAAEAALLSYKHQTGASN